MTEVSLLLAILQQPGVVVVADGTNCRRQIAHGAQRPAPHAAVLLAKLIQT